MLALLALKRRLEQHGEHIAAVDGLDHHLILGRRAVGKLQHLLDLGGEHIAALHLDHVVGAARQDVDTRVMTAELALAVAGDDARQVMRTVADKRRALLAQRGEHQLAHFAVGQLLAGLRVDDLAVHVVFPDMHAMMLFAGDADARAVDLGQAIDIEDLDAQLVGDALAHLLTPTLGADDALAQVKLIAQAALLDLLGKQQRIAGRARDDGGMQVLHHLQLLFGIAGAHRDGHGAQALAAQLEADAGSPQAITRGNLDAVGVRDARRLVAAREHGGPIVDILLRVGDDDRGARGARGAVDADDLLVRHRLQSQRVCLAQIRFFRERQLLEIFLGLHIGQIDVLEFASVEGRAVLQGFELLFDDLKLLRLHLHSMLPCPNGLLRFIHAA